MIATLVLATPLWAVPLNDPTRPPEVESKSTRPAAAAAPRVLRSIRVDRTGNVATINGVTLREGDRLDDAKIKTIGPDEVILSTAAGDQRLRLFPGVVKSVHRDLVKPSLPVASRPKRQAVAATGATPK